MKGIAANVPFQRSLEIIMLCTICCCTTYVVTHTFISRSDWNQPVRWHIRQWPATSGPRETPHCRDGADGRTTLLHFSSASRLARLRQQDTVEILRDRHDKARDNRRV